MIGEEQTITVDEFEGKEARCPDCGHLLFKQSGKKIQVKCNGHKCKKLIVVSV